jgi:hypothetical protein
MDLASDQVFADLDFVEISQTTLGAAEEATANVPARKLIIGFGPNWNALAPTRNRTNT